MGDQNDERQRALDGMVGLYRDVTDGIIRAEQKLTQSHKLRNLTVARMVDFTGNVAEVAKLIGKTETYVRNAVAQSNGVLCGMATPERGSGV